MTHQLPNIVLIVLDTHRADRLGCYGYQQPTSPNINAFAQGATLFENAIAPAQWTIPSHASMFSGEYSSTHQVVQSGAALHTAFPTSAEYLRTRGYTSTGFCNNPLVGVLNNGLRRGFDAFYNYGGTVPTIPSSNGHNGHKTPNLFTSLRNGYRTLIDRIATPIQQAVASSTEVFQVILNPRLVSLWTRYANFKGDTGASITDATQFIQHNLSNPETPQFVFLNLMETHLPYSPPDPFVRQFAPIIKDEPAARDFMRAYNTQALRWLLPLEAPYSDLEAQTLSQMYDAEIAYQDHLLQRLFSMLDTPEHRENTMVILVADHGEMLGEHQYMGHGLGLYQELIRVPLVIRTPGQTRGERVSGVVSTTRLFDTVLDAAGIRTVTTRSSENAETRPRSLGHSLNFDEQNQPLTFSEAFPPDNIIQIMRKHEPELMTAFHCQAIHRTVIQQSNKLYRVENVRDQLFDLENDPFENQAIETNEMRQTLMTALDEHTASAIKRRASDMHATETDNLTDEAVLERLRGLGYIE